MRNAICLGLLVSLWAVYSGCGLLTPCDGQACISELDIRVNRSDGTRATDFRGTVGNTEVRCSSDPNIAEKNCKNDRILIDGYGDDDQKRIAIDLKTTGPESTEQIDGHLEPTWQETGVDKENCPTCYRARETVSLKSK